MYLYLSKRDKPRQTDRQTDAHNRQNISNQRPEYINHI